jgi:hypothetical protein
MRVNYYCLLFCVLARLMAQCIFARQSLEKQIEPMGAGVDEVVFCFQPDHSFSRALTTSKNQQRGPYRNSALRFSQLAAGAWGRWK